MRSCSIGSKSIRRRSPNRRMHFKTFGSLDLTASARVDRSDRPLGSAGGLTRLVCAAGRKNVSTDVFADNRHLASRRILRPHLYCVTTNSIGGRRIAECVFLLFACRRGVAGPDRKVACAAQAARGHRGLARPKDRCRSGFCEGNRPACRDRRHHSAAGELRLPRVRILLRKGDGAGDAAARGR